MTPGPSTVFSRRETIKNVVELSGIHWFVDLAVHADLQAAFLVAYLGHAVSATVSVWLWSPLSFSRMVAAASNPLISST